MLSKDIRKYVIVPTLQAIDMWSPSAEILVYGTGMVETGYQYLVQIGNPYNGGNGFFQEEESDFNDLYQWIINGFNKGLAAKILSICGYSALPKDVKCVITDMRFAVICCRLHYWRIKKAIPAANDARGFSEYHKAWYNSSLGAANVDKNTEIFTRIINEEL